MAEITSTGTPTVGTGAVLTLGTSTLTANILSIQHSGHGYEEYEVTNLSTSGGRLFQPTELYDPGTLTLEILFEPTVGVGWGTLADNTHEQDETVKISYPISFGSNNSTKATLQSAKGFLKSIEYTLNLEERNTATVVVRMSGSLVHTDEA